jgi:hypothetical protein
MRVPLQTQIHSLILLIWIVTYVLLNGIYSTLHYAHSSPVSFLRRIESHHAEIKVFVFSWSWTPKNWEFNPPTWDSDHTKRKRRNTLRLASSNVVISLLLVSTDGLIGEEAKTVRRKLSKILAEKWGKSYSEVSGYANTHMSIGIVRATHCCLRCSRVPTIRCMSTRRPQWEDKLSARWFDPLSALFLFLWATKFSADQTHFILLLDAGPDCFPLFDQVIL